MSKGNIVSYGIIILVVLFVGQNLLGQIGKYKAEIKAAEKEKSELVESKQVLETKVADLTKKQEGLQAQIDERDGKINGLRGDLAKLEKKLTEDHAEIVRIRSDDDSVARFKKTFPEFANGMTVVERSVPSEKVPSIIVPVNFVMLPVGFADYFIDLKTQVDSLAGQKEKLVQIDSLQTENRDLLKQVLELEREKSAEYYRGYEEAFAKYMTLSGDYVKLLKEKRFSLGTTMFQAIGGFVGGIALGVGL